MNRRTLLIGAIAALLPASAPADAAWQDGIGVHLDLPTRAGSGTTCQTTQLVGRIDASGTRPSDTVSVRLLHDRPGIASLLGTAATPNYCATSTAGPLQANLSLTDNTFTIPAEQIPADPDCWTLAVEAACLLVTTPLSTVVPAQEPGRIDVVLAAGNTNAAAVAATHGLRIVKQIPLAALQRQLVVFGFEGQQIDVLIAQLSADPAVETVQPDFIYRTSAEPGIAAPAAAQGDPFAFLAYGPKKIGAAQLQSISTGRGEKVVVIDTGVDLEHPELVGRIAAHEDFTGLGWSADQHGTAVAGIIAALANNGEGSYGVAPEAVVIAYKACAPRETGGLLARCWTNTLVQALDAALASDARIINLSVGGPPDPLVARYAALALAKGRLLVAAAGNGGPLAQPTYPAALPEVLAVTAVDIRDQGYTQATLGDFIDVAAPGVDIVSPSPARTYPVLSGTSMAAAHVSGAAALLLQLVPTASVESLRAALVDRAVDLGPPGPDVRFGVGEIDICAAAQQLSEGARGCER